MTSQLLTQTKAAFYGENKQALGDLMDQAFQRVTGQEAQSITSTEVAAPTAAPLTILADEKLGLDAADLAAIRLTLAAAHIGGEVRFFLYAEDKSSKLANVAASVTINGNTHTQRVPSTLGKKQAAVDAAEYLVQHVRTCDKPPIKESDLPPAPELIVSITADDSGDPFAALMGKSNTATNPRPVELSDAARHTITDMLREAGIPGPVSVRYIGSLTENYVSFEAQAGGTRGKDMADLDQTAIYGAVQQLIWHVKKEK